MAAPRSKRLLMGAQISDWFASTYVGDAVTYALYLVLMKAVMRAGAAPKRIL